MPQTKVILADGTVFENGRVGYSSGFLWVYLSGMEMSEVAEIFCNSGKTNKIIFEYGADRDEYDDYTKCVVISLVDNVSVCMTKNVGDGDQNGSN